MVKDVVSFELVELIVTAIVSVVVALVASSGFWGYILKKAEIKEHERQQERDIILLERQLLMGLAHDKINYLAQKYIERGWMTQDDYENLFTYLYKPYLALGGNGTTKKMMDEVDKLPIKTQTSASFHKDSKNAQQ